jgi:hypothetical protein
MKSYQYSHPFVKPSTFACFCIDDCAQILFVAGKFKLRVGLQVHSFNLVYPFVVGGHHDLSAYVLDLVRLLSSIISL